MKKILKIIFVFALVLLTKGSVLAADRTIDSDFHNAKFLNDDYGSLEFITDEGDPVIVTNSSITGNIWGDVVGWINLQPGNDNGLTIDNNDEISGYAWGQNAGWISFNCKNPDGSGDCSQNDNFHVSINSSDEFEGFAWSENYGWIQFDCNENGACVKIHQDNSCSGGCGGFDHCPDNPLYPLETNGMQAQIPTGFEVVGGVCKPIVYTPPTDVCPDNSSYPETIGNQSQIPDNFEKINGFCLPLTITDDVCPDNSQYTETIGNQTQVPDGFEKVNGVCQPITYLDVCPDNSQYPETIGNQSQIPDNFEKKDGFCIPIIITDDICPDLEQYPETLGNQTSVPSGFEKINGVCTPVTTVYECSDGDDNDGDDLIDEDDPGCHTDNDIDKAYNPTDNNESNTLNTCYVIDGESPTLWQTINCMIEETIDHTKEILENTWNQIKYVFVNPEGNILTKTIAITGLAFGTAFTLLPYLFSTPFSFSELVLMPYRLWSLLMSILGLRKRVRPWGTVYDSVTKQPLDPVVVDLFDAEGKKVQTSITDMDGRYGFLTEPGHYWMRPRKTHYSFPSFKLAGKTRDEIYLDLYFGNFFEVKTGEEVITKNIPMDREHFDWNEFAKKDQKLMKFYSKRDIWLNRIADSLFSFGFFVSFIALISSQSIYNIIIFALYIIMLVVRETGIKQNMFGRVMMADGTPLSYAVIKVYSTIGNIEVARKVANQYGKYYCLLQNGHYIVTIERKNADESYTLVYTSDTIEVSKGVINTHFKI